MTAKQRKLLWLGVALIVFGALKAGLIYWYLHNKPAAAKPLTLSCDIGRGGCALPGGGRLAFSALPEHGRPFELRLSGLAGETAPTVDFSMPDMDMGFNRYVFVRDGAGWKATVTLPMCVSGSRSWVAELKDGRVAYRLPFSVR